MFLEQNVNTELADDKLLPRQCQADEPDNCQFKAGDVMIDT